MAMETDRDKNKNLMRAIRMLHSQMAVDNLDKYRNSQRNLGALLKVSFNGVKFEETKFAGVKSEWVRADRKHDGKRVILYCHGGGFFTGSLEYARSITAKLASSTSMDVLSFNYRLAPEHPFPGALEDALKVWDQLMYEGYGARDVIVAGDSAGGNLALVLCHKLKALDRQLPKGIVCISPWTDLMCRGKTHEEKREIDPILDKEYIESAIEAYAQGEDLENPLISPLYGDFSEFPPVYIQTGENEILLSDSRALHKKIISQGGFSHMDVYKGMWHVFQMAPFKKARKAVDEIADFIYEIYR